MTVAAVEERAHELAALMAEAVGCDVMQTPGGIETPLRSLDFESLQFVAFLVQVEEDYGFEWDLDTPPEAMSTIRAIAELMVGTKSGSGA